ncbi:MAG: HAD family hydrolase [Planctomycetota bacterium]|jgi:beta-phosphoglucomutase-like phosphatase (HAD superfamily)
MGEVDREKLREVLEGAEALIFGLDGVLVNSDRQKYESYLRAVDQLGTAFSFEFYKTLIGRSRIDTCKAIVEHCALDLTAPELAELRGAEVPGVYAEFGMDVIFGARKLLTVLPRDRYRLGLVSSSTRERVELALEELDFDFDSVVSGEGLKPKPAPDLYLKCLEELGVEPGRAVVFDDAGNGIKAAVAAGCRPVAVPTDATRAHDFSGAVVVIDSLWQAGEFLV